jgi:CRISPR/Cas system-associated protein Csx1
MGNRKEHQLLALLYKVEELLIELKTGGVESEDYKDLEKIIMNLENYLKGRQDLM